MNILIISHNSFSSTDNNGKTLEALFSFAAKDSIGQLYFSQNEHPDFSFCDNYFQITDLDVLLKLIRRTKYCGKCISQNNIDNKSNFFFKIAKKHNRFLAFLRDLLWKTGVWKTDRLYTWCKNLNPDLIFFVGGGMSFSHDVSIYLSKKLAIPLVTYFTDDYLIYPKNRNFLDFIQRKRMKSFYKHTIEFSALLFSIGDLMSYEYSNFFRKPFHPIMNSVKIIPYEEYRNSKNITISYFGGLHLDRWKMIIRLSKFANNIKILVYCSNKPDNYILNQFKEHNIMYMGRILGEDLKKTMINSDILLHVESDDKYYRSLTKLSLSTKIPEYLITGRPIIGFGPSEVASMKILSDNNIGFVIPSNASDKELQRYISEISNNYELRKSIGYSGYSFAKENFNNIIITKKFKAKLESIL